MAEHVVKIPAGDGWLSGSCNPGEQVDGADERDAVSSWGPTFGPETAEDVVRPVVERRGWHPPGGSI